MGVIHVDFAVWSFLHLDAAVLKPTRELRGLASDLHGTNSGKKSNAEIEVSQLGTFRKKSSKINDIFS